MKIFIGKNISCSINYEYRYLITLIIKYNIGDIVLHPNEADVLIFPSSCSGAKKQIIQTLSYLEKTINEKKKGAITIISGCITRSFYNEKMNKNISDFLTKNFDYIVPEHREDIIINLLLNKEVLSPDFGACLINNNCADIFITSGCMNKCSFCKINYQELPLKSVPFEEIQSTIDELPQQVDTITLLGTNLCQYGLDLYEKTKLMQLVNILEDKVNINKVDLIGFAYKDAIKNNFADVMSQMKKINSIVGSLESGSDRLLKLMNKGFTSSEFLEFIKEINRNYSKSLVLDIIAGFPTESISDINTTLNLLKQVNPNKVVIHKYCDAPMLDSHKYEQLTETEIDEHYKIYKKALKKCKK